MRKLRKICIYNFKRKENTYKYWTQIYRNWNLYIFCNSCNKYLIHKTSYFLIFLKRLFSSKLLELLLWIVHFKQPWCLFLTKKLLLSLLLLDFNVPLLGKGTAFPFDQFGKIKSRSSAISVWVCLANVGFVLGFN